MKLRAALLLAVLAAPAAAHAGARQEATVLMSENAATRAVQDEYGFADAVVSGDTAYLSGVIAAPAPGETSLEPAYTRAFTALGRTLKRAGMSFDDVIDMTTYHTDLAAQAKPLAVVKARFMRAPAPAWTAIGVSGLFAPEGVTEIKLVARRAASAGRK